MVALTGTAQGDNSTAVTGVASGQNSLGVLGEGDLQGIRGHGAVGVRGEGASWNGVEGISQSTTGGFGVFGANTSGGTGVAGISTNWIGVYGETSGVENGPAGIWGEHKGAGIGVKAVTKDGVGLVAVATGSGTAASLQGGVDVTGQLNVQGVSFQSLLQRIHLLEQQVAALMSTPGGRQISVSKQGAGPSSVFTVTGSGFSPNKLVVIKVTDAQLQQLQFAETTNASGGFTSPHSVSCVSGGSLTFTAFEDSDPTHTFANAVVTTCP